MYLANALVPESSRVLVTGQQRDGDQRELTIDYIVSAQVRRSYGRWLLVGLPVAVLLLMRFRSS